MKRFPVNSKNLLEVGYDHEKKLLEVVFRAAPGWVYTYRHVPVMKFVRLITATSVGGFFGREIRSFPKKFPYTRRKV